MGFYSPSQLVQDAQRHHILILPTDVNHSDWDHQLLSSDDARQPPIRLGLRLVKGLSQAAGKRISDVRRQRAFTNVADLRRRASLDRKNMEALAAADALSSISGHRHQTHWQTMALEDHQPLLPAEASLQHEARSEVRLPTPSLGEEVLADYQSTGLSLKAHPLALLRTQ